MSKWSDPCPDKLMMVPRGGSGRIAPELATSYAELPKNRMQGVMHRARSVLEDQVPTTPRERRIGLSSQKRSVETATECRQAAMPVNDAFTLARDEILER